MFVSGEGKPGQICSEDMANCGIAFSTITVVVVGAVMTGLAIAMAARGMDTSLKLKHAVVITSSLTLFGGWIGLISTRSEVARSNSKEKREMLSLARFLVMQQLVMVTLAILARSGTFKPVVVGIGIPTIAILPFLYIFAMNKCSKP